MNKIIVDSNFPGGNILLDSIEDNLIKVHQDLRDTDIDWFYWYFRVLGAAGRNLEIQFTESQALGGRGPAVSLDGGLTWRWLGAVQNQCFTYFVPPDQAEVRFSFGMPYLQSNLDQFLKPLIGHPALREDVLCLSRKGRPVELLNVGCLEKQADFHILLTCRHHCCEMMASYSLEGVIQKVLDETEPGGWLRQHVTFWLVPFMDKDGVEDGDQGKNRRPWDHNRDYVGESIYPEVAAVRNLVSDRCGGRLDMAFDLHCPWIKGFLNEFIYFVGGQKNELWQETNAFSDILAANRHGPILFFRENNLPFGVDWNTGSEPGRKSFSEWASELPGIKVANTIELPYANALGVEVNPKNARAFGEDLAEAIYRYFRN